MELFSLRSSSRGNAALVYTRKTKILVDCGISGKVAEEAMAEFDVRPEELDGIVVTHEHTDHIAGVGVMMRRYKLPVWANRETWISMSRQIGRTDESLIKIFDNNENFEIGEIGVVPFSIPHDAENPVGYSFIKNGDKVSVATDIGELQKEMFVALRGSKTVILEANHDVNMLEIGSYPLSLKRRIRGSLGHLSNDDAGKAAEFLVKLGTEKILLGHLSEENNYPDLAVQTVASTLKSAGIKIGTDVILGVAARDAVASI